MGLSILKLDFWGENKPKIDPLPSRNLSKLKELTNKINDL